MESGIERTVRVFISSTFRDMHAERDHLVTVVFPELRERLERLGLDFFDVDLRWGVPETGVDGERANSWAYCKQWIDRVEPFFICMLGQRYGWAPPADEIADEADRRAYAGLSITEMEVRHAVLGERRKSRSFFYFREKAVPDGVPAAVRDNFVDQAQPGRLQDLKVAIGRANRPVRPYSCRWAGQGFADLDAFGQMVLEDLWSGVLRDERYVSKEAWRSVRGREPADDPLYMDDSTPISEEAWRPLVDAAKPIPADPLDAEAAEMAAFAAGRLRWFRGRGKELEALREFIEEPTDSNTTRVCVVRAGAGAGKSALLAKLAEQLAASSHLVVSHFVGATERSADTRSMLERFVQELDRHDVPTGKELDRHGVLREVEKNDLHLEGLKRRFASQLESYGGVRRIVLIVDGVDDLTDGHDMSWLPLQLGNNVRVVLSCEDATGVSQLSSEAKDNTALSRREPAPRALGLGPLEDRDIRDIVRDYLREYCKELDQDQQNVIVSMPPARNPLYLLVMLHELRTLGGEGVHLRVREIIADFPERYPDTRSLFGWVLERLDVFGEEAGRRWWTYLELGRVGMSGRELRDLVGRALSDEGARAALRIERSIRRYLQRRGSQWDFLNGQLRDAVRHRYDCAEPIYHVDIARYLETRWREDDKHAISELPYHQRCGSMWAELEQTLCDLTFLEAKCAVGLTFDIVRDYSEALRSLPEGLEALTRRREQEQRASQWTGDLLRYARAWTDRRDCEAHGEPVEASGPDLPEIPIACRMWTQEEIAAEIRRMAEHPMRMDRVESFASFAKSECHSMQQFGQRAGFVAQHAWNFTPTGPVHAAAAILLRRGGTPSLLRRWAPNDQRNPRPVPLATLEGHSGGVTGVRVTPDGRRAVSWSHEDQTVRVWDLETGACERTLKGHTSHVTSVQVTADGRRAVWMCFTRRALFSPRQPTDYMLRVWDLETGACVQTIEGHSRVIETEGVMQVTPDGRRMVSGGSKPWALRVWDLEDGALECTLEGHTALVRAVDVTPDGRHAISGSWDQTLRVWDLEAGACVRTLEGHTGQVTSVHLTPDGRHAISGSTDRTVRMWDLETGTCARALEGHIGDVFTVQITPDGRRAVSGSTDGTVRVWDLQAGACVRILEGHSRWVSSVAVTPDGRLAASGSDDHTVRVWDLEAGAIDRTLQRHSREISCVDMTPEGKWAVTGANDRTLRVWDVQSGVCVRTIEDSSFASVQVTPDGRRAVSGGLDHTVRLWDLESGACLRTFEGHSKMVSSVQVTPGGRRAVSAGSWDRTLRLWDLESGACLQTLRGHEEFVSSVHVTPDGRQAVSGSWDTTLRVWDLETGACVWRRENKDAGAFARSYMVTTVQVTCDGRRVVSGDVDGTLRVWDLESGACLRTIKGHSRSISNVRLIADGRGAVSLAADGTLCVFELGVCPSNRLRPAARAARRCP